MRKLSALFAACIVASVFAGCGLGSAPGTGTASSSSAALSPAAFANGDAFALLPAGDVMMTIDAGTLINTTAPAILANSPKEKAEFEKGMLEVQEKTSIDPKQIKLVAVSMTLPKSSGEKPQFAGVMTGSWDTAKLTETLKKDEKTKADRPIKQYEGQTIIVNTKDGQETGVVVLDSTTLLMGSPVLMVEKAIDAKMGKGDNAAKDAELLAAFKSTKETGTLRFAMKFPKEQLAGQTDDMAKHMAATKILFGSLDASAGLGIELVARTASEADAKPIHDDLAKLLEQAKGFVGGMEQMKSFEPVLNSVVLTLNGADVKLAISVPTATIEQLAKTYGAMTGGTSGGEMPGGDSSMPELDEDKEGESKEK